MDLNGAFDLGTVSLGGGGSIVGSAGGSISAAACSLSGDSSITLLANDNYLGAVSVECGSTISGNYTADSCMLVADDGTTDTVTSLPAAPVTWDLSVTNGTTLSLGGACTFGTVTVTDGSIAGGWITAWLLVLDNATIGSNLSLSDGGRGSAISYRSAARIALVVRL